VGNIFGKKYFGGKYFWQEIFWQEIVLAQNIFGGKYFAGNILAGSLVCYLKQRSSKNPHTIITTLHYCSTLLMGAKS
jgi:hypothetical protein